MPGAPVVPSQMEEALARLERSVTFARAGSQLRLLRFLVEHGAGNPGTGLSEGEIGSGFFQRESAYDTSNDAIVRVSVTRLRAKLKLYYESEGAADPVRLSIPVGSYSPRVEELRDAETASASPVAANFVDTGVGKADPPKRTFGLRVVLAAAALLLALSVFGVRMYRHKPPVSWLEGSLQLRPVTVGDGSDAFPAFSPDGWQIAYSGRTPEARAYSLYIKPVSSSGPGRRVPSPAGDALHAAWSPDGKSMAYLLVGPHDAAIEVTDLTTGTAREVARLPWYSLLDEQAYIDSRTPGPAWTRDGAALVFALRSAQYGPERLVMLNLASGARTALTTGDADEEDGAPEVSPDGRTLAFFRKRTPSDADVDLLDLQTRTPAGARAQLGGLNGLAWSGSGKELVVSANRGRTGWGVWRLPLEGAPSLLAITAQLPIEPALSPAGNVLAMTLVHLDSTIVSVSTIGKEAAERRVFPTSELTEQLKIAPDGRQMAFLSDQSGTRQVWLGTLEEGKLLHASQLTAALPAQPIFLAWSPDSRRLAVVLRGPGQNGIHLLDVATQRLTRLETPCLDGGVVPQAPVWSEDGRSITFSAIHEAQSGIYRTSTGGVPACVRLSQVFTHQAIPDGDHGFILAAPRGAGMLRVAEGSNSPRVLAGLEDVQPGRNWTVQDGVLLYIDVRSAVRVLRGYDPRTGQSRILSPPLERVGSAGFSYSASQHLLLFHQHSDTDDRRLSSLLLTSRSRSLDRLACK